MRPLAAAAAAGAALALGAGACGGPSEADRKVKERVAFERYRSRVEAGCRATAEKLRSRGAPSTLQDLARLAEPAQADMLRLRDAIAGERVPAGSAKRVETLREAVESVRKLLPAFSGTISSGTLDELADLTGALSARLVDVEFSGREAGVRCIDARQRKALETAMLGPIYVEQFARFDRVADRKLRRFASPSGGSTDELGHYFERLYEVVQDLRGRFDLLAVPDYAMRASDAYGDLLYDLEQALLKTSEELKRRGTVTPTYAARVGRRLDAAVSREPQLLRRLLRTLRKGLPESPGSGSDEPTPA